MNKAELVAAVARRTDSSPADARRHVDAVIESIIEGVSAGERVSLIGFGTFDSTARAARTARNPRTGATVDVPAAVVPRFRVGAGFKAKVAGADGARPAGKAAAGSPTGTTKKKAAAPAEEPATPAKDGSKDGKKKSSKKDKGSKKDSKKKSKKGKKSKKK
ncbi:HU family DNA-binding protein [Isoptericola sp. G70]|uniref:HU family DNA-binding protein n=1 Tax=Isoptericola sp. G70 TaxID=3376633 RepID=UPI003A813099